MKKLLLLIILALLFSGSANALCLSDTEYETLSINSMGKPDYVPGDDLGYYIWSDSNLSWHIRWSGDSNLYDVNSTPNYLFTGSIYVTADTSSLVVTEYKFESNDWSTTILDQTALFLAYANAGDDGLDIQLSDTCRYSYIAFDLHIYSLTLTGTNPYPVGQFITIGADGYHPISEDFKMAVSPVPEPATGFLILFGFIGIFSYAIPGGARWVK